jgi:hypothetical protein
MGFWGVDGFDMGGLIGEDESIRIGSCRLPPSEGDVRSRTSLGLNGGVTGLVGTLDIVFLGLVESMSDGPATGSSLMSMISPHGAGDCTEFVVFMDSCLSNSA